MEQKGGVEELISRERKIFRFLVFYVILAFFLIALFIFSGLWLFIEMAILVLAMEIVITGLVKVAKPLHTNKKVEKELCNMADYMSLKNEYISNKNSTIVISISVYSLVSMAFLLFVRFSYVYLILFATGAMVIYSIFYIFFRYKLDKIAIVLLKRREAIREMKQNKKTEKKTKATKSRKK